MKVVYNSLIHPYLNYSILNWGRASNTTIQPLIKLQNKAIKTIKPTNTKSLEELFQHLNISCLPKIYTFISRQIHALLSQQTASKPLWRIFHSNQLNSFSLHKTSNLLIIYFYLELTLPQENVPSPLLALKCGFQYQILLFRSRIFGVRSGENYENFLDPEPDWISFLLKPDPDYPKRFEHFLIFSCFVFSCENFFDNLRDLMLDDVIYVIL